MENRELKRIMHEATEDAGIKGVMALTELCDIRSTVVAYQLNYLMLLMLPVFLD